MRASAILTLAVLLFDAPAALAQSGWGLAITPGGFYFCDMGDRVWKRDRRGGLHVVLTRNHCHTLLLAYDGVVYGEDVGGESRLADTVSLWRLGPGDRREFVLAPTADPDPSVWIVRDRLGNAYAWSGDAGAKRESEILKRTPGGDVSVLAGREWGDADGHGAAARLGSVAGLAVTPDGTVYVLEEGNLRKVLPDGTVTTIARNVADRRTGGVPNLRGLWNHSGGLALDARENVYVVDHYGRRWVEVDRQGMIRVLARAGGIANALTRSQFGWLPSGIAVAGEDVFIMDTWPLPRLLADIVGSPRIRRISPDGRVTTVFRLARTRTRAIAAAVVLTLCLLPVGWRWSIRRGRAL